MKENSVYLEYGTYLSFFYVSLQEQTSDWGFLDVCIIWQNVKIEMH